MADAQKADAQMADAQAERTEICETYPQILRRNARQTPDLPAYREKRLGIWRQTTWAEALAAVDEIAAGFVALGVGKGDSIALISYNRPEIYWSILAAQSIGAVPTPLYHDGAAEEMAYVLHHCEAKLAVVEDQEQIDKLAAVADETPNLKHKVYVDPRGLESQQDKAVHDIAALRDAGRRKLAENPGLIDAAVAAGRGDDLAVLLYTSGTTGRPKGVLLSHDNVRISSENANRFDNLEGEEILAYLPVAWIGDHIFSHGQALLGRFTVNCPESEATVVNDLREIGPSYYFAPPRVFEGVLTHIMVRMNDAGRLARLIYRFFMDHAARVGCAILDGAETSRSDRLLYALGRFLVYNPLRDRIGLGRVRVAYTAGEAIGGEVFNFYRSLGVNLKQLYGQTEATVYVAAQPDGEIFHDTVGLPCRDVEIRIEDSGEVSFRGPGAFVGYYKDAAATDDIRDVEGWVKTGDAGIIAERGHLKIIDRAADVSRLAGGDPFSPKYIENKLKFSHMIADAVAFGDNRDSVAAFIVIDGVAAQSHAEMHNIVFGSYQDLTVSPAIREVVERDILRVNDELEKKDKMASCAVRRYIVLPKALDADDGEITRTKKVRRKVIAERYKNLIDALYADVRSCPFDLDISFEDGKKGRLTGTVDVHDVPAAP